MFTEKSNFQGGGGGGIVCKFRGRGGGLGRKKGVMFLREGELIPRCTLWWLYLIFFLLVRDTVCSYPVMELCTKHLSQHIATLKVSNSINFKVIVYDDASYILSIERLNRCKHEL